MRFMETGEMRNDKDTAMTAKLWADTTFRSSEILNRSGDGVREILAELKSISISLGKREITSLNELNELKKDLSGGNDEGPTS